MLAERIDPTALTRHDDASLLAALAEPAMPRTTRALVESLRARRLHKRAVEFGARSGDLYRHLDRLYGAPAERRKIELAMARSLTETLGVVVEPHEVLIDIPKPERWRTDVWVWFERPPVGFRPLMPWNEVVGLGDVELKRYEDHRRLIRLVTTERLRDEVSRRWEALLMPLIGGMA